MSRSGRSLGQIAQTVGVTNAPTTNATTLTTVPDMTISLTSRGGNLIADGDISFSHGITDVVVSIAVVCDGTTMGPPMTFQDINTSRQHSVHVKGRVAAPAGAHTIAMQWMASTTNGAILATGVQRTLIVQELPN